MKHPTKTTDRHRRQPRGELVGRIVHVHFNNLEFLMNHFAVILQETAKTVVFARLATVEQIDEECDYYAGREQPLLQDGKLAAAALVKVYRGILTRGLIEMGTGKTPPKTTLLARLRMDEKFFHQTVRIQPQRPQPGEVLVQVIRLIKDESQCPKSFSSRTHYPHRYYFWDGQAHDFAYPGFARPTPPNSRR